MDDSTRKLWVPLETKQEPARQPQNKAGSWYLITGLILGLLFGLAYAWLVDPVIYENTTPASLKDSYKDTYRSMIAQTYQETGNLTRAVNRLALLEDPDPVYALGVQAQQALAERQPEEAHALALLASALQGGASTQDEPLPTAPVIPTRTLPPATPIP